MGKIFGIFLLLLIAVIVGFLVNLLVDLVVILLKKAVKKIRMIMGVPYKEEITDVEEVPEQEESPKQNTNDILQKILAKRKNSTSDVEHPADKGDEIEVTDYEFKE